MSALEMETFILFVMKCDVCKFLATCTIDSISKSRMIGVKFGAVRQNLISKSIQVLNSSGKPRNRTFCGMQIPKSSLMFQMIVFWFHFMFHVFGILKSKKIVTIFVIARYDLEVSGLFPESFNGFSYVTRNGINFDDEFIISNWTLGWAGLDVE